MILIEDTGSYQRVAFASPTFDNRNKEISIVITKAVTVNGEIIPEAIEDISTYSINNNKKSKTNGIIINERNFPLVDVISTVEPDNADGSIKRYFNSSDNKIYNWQIDPNSNIIDEFSYIWTEEPKEYSGVKDSNETYMEKQEDGSFVEIALYPAYDFFVSKTLSELEYASMNDSVFSGIARYIENFIINNNIVNGVRL